MAEKDLTHGMSGTRPYNIWMNMRSRCDNTKSDFYSIYGGRGISYCEAWRTFEGFWADMSSTYIEGMSLERVDNNLNYTPSNCCWIPIKDQALNRRKASNNTSGHTGVLWGHNRLGVLYARARWCENGKDVCKYFSAKKFGAEEAFRLACECRENAINKLRDQGKNYGANHGK